MGTVVTIEIYSDIGVPGEIVADRFEAAESRFFKLDRIFSTWEPQTPMSLLRRGALAVEDAPSEISDVLALCELARAKTRGWFDPWAMPGGVDPTGLVKGWAAETTLVDLHAPGVSGAVVNAAGDIASFGHYLGNVHFRFGVVDPWDSTKIEAVVQSSGALATSGTAERGEHLLDPFSGVWHARAVSATVSGPSLAMADAFATALAVSGEGGLGFVEEAAGYEALLVTAGGGVAMTAGFPVV